VRARVKAEEVEEVREVKEKSGGVAAFFDLDGTLVAPPSLERRFFGMLRYRRAIPAKNYLLWLREAVRLAPRGVGKMLQTNKRYLRGIAVNPWSTAGLNPAPKFFGEGLERIAWHAGKEHRIVLLSGTLEPLAQAASRAIESGLASRGIISCIRICATCLEVADGRWTGKILREAMIGEAKGRAVKEIALEMNLDLAHSYAYGDSADDRWLLAAVGRPFAVNPAAELGRLARMLGWPSLSWAGKENSTQRSRVRREIEDKKALPRMIA
jgi:putative phosphoserine phosphatase/1-acylglycerol-3-phosphate O-acyltransferase